MKSLWRQCLARWQSAWRDNEDAAATVITYDEATQRIAALHPSYKRVLAEHESTCDDIEAHATLWLSLSQNFTSRFLGSNCPELAQVALLLEALLTSGDKRAKLFADSFFLEPVIYDLRKFQFEDRFYAILGAKAQRIVRSVDL